MLIPAFHNMTLTNKTEKVYVALSFNLKIKDNVEWGLLNMLYLNFFI